MANDGDVEEFVRQARALPPESLHSVRSNLTVLSLLSPISSMPNPVPQRERIAMLLTALEAS
jgi:hypothetical protein